jgi:hypothetical protein
MSDNFHTHPKPGTFTGYPTDFERLEVAEAHIERLTALGAAMFDAGREAQFTLHAEGLHDDVLQGALDKWENRG